MTTAIRLWTIQHQDAWERAERSGILRADGRYVGSSFRPAYRWMRDQMQTRITGATGCYSIWAWAWPKPDLRRTAHLTPSTPGVRIEFVAPLSAVLLSDFDAWHCVLNQSYLALTEEELDAWESRAGRGQRFSDLSPARQAEMRESWTRIFDLTALLEAPEWHGGRAERQFVQATLEAVALADVKRVRPFIAR